MKNILTIWLKELKDTLRDKKTLYTMILMPVFLMPALLIGMGELTKSQITKIEQNPITLAVQGSANAPELAGMFNSNTDWYQITQTDDAQQAVKGEETLAGLKLADDFMTAIENNEPANITIYTNSTKTASSEALQRIHQTISVYNQLILDQRLQANQVDNSIIMVTNSSTEDVTTDEQKGGFLLSMILPLFIVMWTIVGGQYTAIDLSAGEKERKTLEALLMTPASRLEIIAGKFLAVSTSAITSVVLSIGSLYTAFKFAPFEESMATTDISVSTLALMLGMGILLAFMFSALQLSVCIYAKSYKEAQSYISPLYLVAIIPISIVNAVPDFVPSLPFFFMPGINAVLVFKELLMGVYDTVHILLTVGSLTVSMLISIGIARYIYSKESVLVS